MSDCTLLLVGERLAERTAVVLASDDGGRTLTTRATIPASRLRRILTVGSDLWALGDDAVGQVILFHSTDGAHSWSATSLALREATDMVAGGNTLIVSGRTPTGPVLLVGDGTNWRQALTLPAAAQLRALAADGQTVAAGGAEGDRALLRVSSDGGATFGAVELPATYNAVSGLALRAGALVIGGYRGKQVENATALASVLEVSSGARRDVEVPQAVQLTSPVCITALCLAVTPTGREDAIVRLAGAADRWERMSIESASVPFAFERIVVGQTTAYALGTGSPLMRVQF